MSILLRAMLTVVLASVASASALAALDAAEECAEFITSQVGDAPVSGQLMGTVEIITVVNEGRHFDRVSRELHGIYCTTDGEYVEIDCSTYERAAD